MKKPIVLLIEDEALILIDLEAALTDAGFEVLTAMDGTEALKAFDTHPSRIHGVVTDIRLGKGPNGWDIGHHVRTSIPSMPIVYMSGDSSKDWEAHGVPNSVMVPKPFVHSQILTALSTLMSHSDQV